MYALGATVTASKVPGILTISQFRVAHFKQTRQFYTLTKQTGLWDGLLLFKNLDNKVL